MFMNMINCLCHLINIDTFTASTDINVCYTKEFMHFQVLDYQSFCLSNSRNINRMVIDITTIIIRFSNFGLLYQEM